MRFFYIAKFKVFCQIVKRAIRITVPLKKFRAGITLQHVSGSQDSSNEVSHFVYLYFFLNKIQETGYFPGKKREISGLLEGRER